MEMKIKTLEQFAELINSSEEWKLEFNEIIKANGWEPFTVPTSILSIKLLSKRVYALDLLLPSIVSSLLVNHSTKRIARAFGKLFARSKTPS